MSCPLQQSASELEAWFLNLWNYFIIPYLMGTIMAGIEVTRILRDNIAGNFVVLNFCYKALKVYFHLIFVSIPTMIFVG